jgi:hypothetical protein
MASKRKTEIEKVKKQIKKQTGTSRPSKYIARQPFDEPKSKTFKDPSKPKAPVKRSIVKGGRGRGGGAGGAFLENLK